MKALMGTLRKEAMFSRFHMLGTQMSHVQGFSGSDFHELHQNLGRRCKKLSLESLREVLEDAYDMSHIKVYSLTTYHILLVELGELPIAFYYPSQANYGLSTTTGPPIPHSAS